MSSPYYWEPGSSVRDVAVKADLSDLWIIVPIVLGCVLLATALLAPFCVYRCCKDFCLRGPHPWCWEWAETCVGCFNAEARGARAARRRAIHQQRLRDFEQRRGNSAPRVAHCAPQTKPVPLTTTQRTFALPTASDGATVRVQTHAIPAYLPPADVPRLPAGAEFSRRHEVRQVPVTSNVRSADRMRWDSAV